MTTKDDALKMALDALEAVEQIDTPYFSTVRTAVAACREALAQKDEHEPVAVGEIVQRQAMRNVGGADTGLGYSDGYVTDTWKDVEFYPFYPNDKRRFAPKWNEVLEVGTKLYTTPPKRHPLTDVQISHIWDRHIAPVFGKNGINPVVFARAIEQAHGIGVEHDAQP